MAHKIFCDFCGEEIVPYKNDLIEDNITFDSKIKPGYGGEIKLSIKVCASKELYGDKKKKDICRNCLKQIVKGL